MKPQRVFRQKDNIYDLVDAVVDHGFAAISETKSIAVPIMKRVIKALGPYKIKAIESFYKPSDYVYVVLDPKRYPGGDSSWQPLVAALVEKHLKSFDANI